MDLQSKIALLPVLLPALIASATLHELAHGVVARALGDRTAQDEGRLTLNPMKHLDMFGSLMFLFTFLLTPFAFGWAKPVPVYPRNFRNHKVGMAIVAAAGPLSNFLIALALVAVAVHVLDVGQMGQYTQDLFQYMVQINLVLSVFNLFPMPPLDGSRMIGVFMSDELYEQWSSLDQYAPLFFLALFFLFGNAFQTLLGSAMNQALKLVLILVGAGG